MNFYRVDDGKKNNYPNNAFSLKTQTKNNKMRFVSIYS